MRPGCAGRDKQKETGHSAPAMLFFYKIYYRRNLDTYRYYFRCLREPYVERGGSSSSFSVPASTAHGTDHATGIRRLGWAHRKVGVACPIFSFFNEIHKKNKLNTYI